MKRHCIGYERPIWHGHNTGAPINHWVRLKLFGAAHSTTPLAIRTARGSARLYVEIDGMTFVFTSFEELDHCVDILSHRVLPRPHQLHPEWGCYLNGHWLSRLPAFVKDWGYRQKAVRYLKRARDGLVRELAL